MLFAYKLGLKKLNKRKDEKDQPKNFFNILNYYAAITIQDYVRQTQREKKIKNQILENKIKNKIQKTENVNTFSGGNSQKPKIPPRRLEKRQLSHIYINQPLNQVSNPMVPNSQHIHVQTDHTNFFSQEDHDNFNLNFDQNRSSDKGEKIVENTPQKLNNESKAKFFQKVVATQGNGLQQFYQNQKKSQKEIENKNQDNLKKFQNFHNFIIKKNQLGQKFPIKYATDYESLRPTEQPRKVTIEEFTLLKNDIHDQSVTKKSNVNQQNSLSNIENMQQKGIQANYARSPKNLRIEGLTEFAVPDQYYQMREKFTQNSFTPKVKSQELAQQQQQQRSQNDLGIIIDKSTIDNNSNREIKNNSESNSTEVDPSLKSHTNNPKNNNFFNN